MSSELKLDYFTSDLHFGHKNVIRFCDRPFKTVHQMNEEIITNWNRIISDCDRVFVLGDVFLCPPEEAKEYIEKLNGYKILVKGNHDYNEKKMLWTGFDEFYKSLDYKMPDGRLALLEHRPVPDCMIDEKYDLMMHGHIHVAERVRGKKINVSTDIWAFEPIPISTIQALNLESADDNEFLDYSISEDGVIEISGKFQMEDFAGVAEAVFKKMSKLWPNRRKK